MNNYSNKYCADQEQKANPAPVLFISYKKQTNSGTTLTYFSLPFLEEKWLFFSTVVDCRLVTVLELKLSDFERLVRRFLQ